MSDRRLVVLQCPAGGGHKAAARAVAVAAAEAGVDSEVVDAFELTPAWFSRAYVGAHLGTTERAPWLYGAGFRAFDRRHAVADRIRGALDRALGAGLRRFVRERSPLAVVSTHFFPLAALGRARLAGELDAPLVGVVTDYGAHAFWAEPGVDRFCTPAGRAARDLVRHGVPDDAIVATGIPILPAFGRVPRLVEPADRLRVLVTSGGFGVGPIREVVQSFGHADLRARFAAGIELCVVCGDNDARVSEVRRAAAEAGISAEVVGFERDMARRLTEAHVVIGKPGGLTVSECLAAGRPMVLVGACPGQETWNQQWLVDAGAAVASEARGAAAAVLGMVAGGGLHELAASARDLAAPGAARRVVDVALRVAAPERLRRAA